MKKGAEIPKPLMIGLLAAVVVVIAFFAIRTFATPAAVVDTSKITPERLQDPDRGPAARPESP